MARRHRRAPPPRRRSSRWPWPVAVGPDWRRRSSRRSTTCRTTGTSYGRGSWTAPTRSIRRWRNGSPTRCAFPSSVVDRMVPAATDLDREDIATHLGLIDEAAVSAERHRSWVIRSVDGLAPLAEVGVELVADVAPFERRKLWLLNGPHSAVAYGGLLVGLRHHRRCCDGSRRCQLRAATSSATHCEVAELSTALEPAAFADDALRRFANPTLGHTCVQVGSRRVEQAAPATAPGRGRTTGTGTRHEEVRHRHGHLDCGDRRHRGPRRAASRALGDPLCSPRSGPPPSEADDLRELCHAARVGSDATCRSRRRSPALERLTTEGPSLLEPDTVTVTLGRPGRGSSVAEQVRRFVRTQVAGLWTWPGARCAWSSPTAHGTARCRSLLRAIEDGSRRPDRAAATAVVALGTHAPMSEDAIRCARRADVPACPQPRLVGGRHLRARRSSARGAGPRPLRRPAGRRASMCASTGWSSRAT